MGEDDSSDERRARRYVHRLGARSQNEEYHGEGQRVRDGDQREEDGGWEVGEDHGLDVPESLRDGGGEEHGCCSDEAGYEEEGSELSFLKVVPVAEEPDDP